MDFDLQNGMDAGTVIVVGKTVSVTYRFPTIIEYCTLIHTNIFVIMTEDEFRI